MKGYPKIKKNDAYSDIFNAPFINDLTLGQWLTKESSSEEFRNEYHKTINKQHLSNDILIRYQKNQLNETDYHHVTKHLTYCSECSKRLYNILQEQSKSLYRQMFVQIPFVIIKQIFSLPVCISIVSLTLFSLAFFMPVYSRPVFAAFLVLTGTTFVLMQKQQRRQFVSVFNIVLLCSSFYLIMEYSPVQLRINEIYQRVHAASITDTTSIQFQWEISRYGFADTRANQPMKCAFGAGLWKGRNELLNTDSKSELPLFLKPDKGNDWIDTNFSNYYYLGKWCFIFNYMCLNKALLDKSFIKDQRKIATQFVDTLSFDPHTRKILNSLIDAMQENRMVTDNAAQKNQLFCSNVNYRIRSLEKTLSPDRLTSNHFK
jgi:uncharacterized membrane protein